MTTLTRYSPKLLNITWQKLPEDFILPDEPVESTLQPLLAAALRESLELAGLILESMIIASNFGLCANVDDKTIVKAPGWVYIPSVYPVLSGEIRRSYTPHAEGSNPEIVMEFTSATEGTEYSFNPHYPYGKWYFYEQILKVPVYVIFHPRTGGLEVYHLENGEYKIQKPDQNQAQNQLFLIECLGLFLGVWTGKKAEQNGNWLRWWNRSGSLLLWGSELVEQQRQLVQQERQLTELAEQRANRLAEKLRSLGSNPEDI
jgi:Uma2 family endonuclease